MSKALTLSFLWELPSHRWEGTCGSCAHSQVYNHLGRHREELDTFT